MQTRAPDEGPSDTGIPALGIERRTVIADSEPVGKEDVPTVVTDNGYTDVTARHLFLSEPKTFHGCQLLRTGLSVIPNGEDWNRFRIRSHAPQSINVVSYEGTLKPVGAEARTYLQSSTTAMACQLMEWARSAASRVFT